MHTYTSPPFFFGNNLFQFFILSKTTQNGKSLAAHSSTPTLLLRFLSCRSLLLLLLFFVSCALFESRNKPLVTFLSTNLFCFFSPYCLLFLFLFEEFLVLILTPKVSLLERTLPQETNKNSQTQKQTTTSKKKERKLEPLFLFCVWGAVFLIVPPITQRKKGVRASSMAVVLEQQR